MTKTYGIESILNRAGDSDSRVRLAGIQERVGELLRKMRPGNDWRGPVVGSVASRRAVSLGLVESQIPPTDISADRIRQDIGLDPPLTTATGKPLPPPELPDLAA